MNLRYILLEKQTSDQCELVAQKCSGYLVPESILPPVKRIIVIGDVHSDLRASIRTFKLAKLIDDNLNWIAEPKNTIVVQMGDQIDSRRPGSDKADQSCLSDMKVLDFFTKMDKKARKYGGAVYSLLGNHEILNLSGMFNYVSRKGFEEFDGVKGRTSSFSKGGKYHKLLACTRNTILKIGSWLFVHGGIMPEVSEKYKSIPEMNNVIREWILGKTIGESMELIDHRERSPFWNRYFGKLESGLELENPLCECKFKSIMNTYQIGKMVIAHTPQLKGINHTCGKRVWRTDVGMSSVFQHFHKNLGKLQIIEILDDNKVRTIKE